MTELPTYDFAKIALDNTLSSVDSLLRERGYARAYEPNRIAVNVKMHNIPGFESALEAMNLTDRAHAIVSEHFTELGEDGMWTHWEWFIEDMRRWAKERLLENCDVSPRRWWAENVLPKIEAGEKTGYPAIDTVDSPTAKRWIYESMVQDCEDRIRNRAVIDERQFGFYGRQGGWLGFYPADRLSEMAEDAEDAVRALDDWMQTIPGGDEYNQIVYEEGAQLFADAMARINALEDEIDRIYGVIAEIEEMHSGLGDEFLYRLSEHGWAYLEENYDFREIASRG